MSPFLRFVFGIFSLPLLVLIDLHVSKRGVGKKILYLLLILITFSWIWFGAYVDVFNSVRARFFPRSVQVDNATASSDRGDTGRTVYTVGTSMLPTIKSGTNVTIFDPSIKGISRFDIVSLTSKQTDGSYYMKRVVGMPGDTFSIQNGYIIINGKILKEPYILHNLPTYGNTSLLDCEEYRIPENSYIVMGDNRTVSHDSRVIGFVKKEEIEGVVKTSVKEEYLDAADVVSALPQKIDSKKFLDALNARREASVSGTLRLSSQLTNVAGKRSALIKEQFSEWKTKQIPLDQTLQKEGYRFNLAHEYVTFGHLTEEQLVNQILESTVENDHFTSPKYTDVGVGYSLRTTGACTYPVISVILSWPSNPDYPKETIEFWRKEAEITESNMRALQGFVGNSSYDQSKLQRFIAVEAEMNTIAKQLYNRTRSNTWFTASDNRAVDKYDALVKEAWALDKDLFADTYDENGNRKQ